MEITAQAGALGCWEDGMGLTGAAVVPLEKVTPPFPGGDPCVSPEPKPGQEPSQSGGVSDPLLQAFYTKPGRLVAQGTSMGWWEVSKPVAGVG